MQTTGFCIVQTEAVNANTWALVRLFDGAKKSPAGYIVGRYNVLRDGLTFDEAGEALDLVAAATSFTE